MKEIINNKKVFIIAEAGVNHNGDTRIARKLIDAASRSGADAVKFQSFKAEKLVSRNTPKAGYQKKTTAAGESQYDMIKRLELNERQHIVLLDYCRKKRIEFLSTPFDEESADFLSKIGLRKFKISSGEITNHPLLKHIAEKKKPVILSTGMSNLSEVKAAVKTLVNAGNKEIILLHCVTEYPAPIGDVNLKAIETLRKTFKLAVGYSDHTSGTEIAIAAVALGAVCIEKHLTLSRDMEGPDHKASLEPHEFKELVRSIRHVEAAMGNGVKEPARCEKKYINLIRKSLVASADVPKGGFITRENVMLKRPATGIEPKDFLKVLGKRVRRNIRSEEVIKYRDIL